MNKKLTLGVIISAIIGIVSGLLTTPKSGRDNRLTLKNQADSWKNRILAGNKKR